MLRIVAIIAVWLAAALGAQAQAPTVKLRYGQIPSTIHSVSTLHLFVAQRQGFLAREGIELELIPITGGTDKMVSALMQGIVDVADTATPYLIQAVLDGSDAVAIAGQVANPLYSLIVKPEIASFSDLRGRLVGLSVPVDTISISMRKLLAKHGLGAGEYRTKELVGTPVRFDCLKRGECDGVPLGQPEDLVALAQGYRRLGFSTEAVPSFQFQVLAARRPWAQANAEAVVHLLRALGAAFRFVRDPANRDQVVHAIVEHTGTSADVARDTLALYFEPERGVMPRQGEINVEGLAQVIAFMGEAGALKPPLPAPERFVDLRYLRQLGIE